MGTPVHTLKVRATFGIILYENFLYTFKKKKGQNGHPLARPRRLVSMQTTGEEGARKEEIHALHVRLVVLTRRGRGYQIQPYSGNSPLRSSGYPALVLRVYIFVYSYLCCIITS